MTYSLFPWSYPESFKLILKITLQEMQETKWGRLADRKTDEEKT